MSLRRLCVYVRGLPLKCRLFQKLGGPKVRWGQEEHLIADVIDGLNHLLFVTYRLAGASGVRRQDLTNPPKGIPRPGDEEKKKFRFGTAADARQALGG